MLVQAMSVLRLSRVTEVLICATAVGATSFVSVSHRTSAFFYIPLCLKTLAFIRLCVCVYSCGLSQQDCPCPIQPG